MNRISRILGKIDFFSLRVRLTIGVAAFSALGLSIATWTSWRMQQILIDSHKQNIEQIASRLPRDVEVYSEMFPQKVAQQKAINNLTINNTLLWVKSPDNKILAESIPLTKPSDSTVAQLFSLSQMPLKAQVYKVNDRYFVLCSSSLQVDNRLLGTVFVVRDITRDQTMFVALVWSVGVASVLVIVVMSGAIAFYIKHSLQPLRRISQMTEAIRSADLGQALSHSIIVEKHGGQIECVSTLGEGTEFFISIPIRSSCQL